MLHRGALDRLLSGDLSRSVLPLLAMSVTSLFSVLHRAPCLKLLRPLAQPKWLATNHHTTSKQSKTDRLLVWTQFPKSAPLKSVLGCMRIPVKGRLGPLHWWRYSKEPLIIPSKLGYQVLHCSHYLLSSVKECWYADKKATHFYSALSVETGRLCPMRLPSEFPNAFLSTGWFQMVGCNSVEVKKARNYIRVGGPLSLCVGSEDGSIYTVIFHILLVKDTEFVWCRHSLPSHSRWPNKDWTSW